MCHFEDIKRDDCIKSSIENFIPQLREKHENWNFVTVEPFATDSLFINYQNTNQFTGNFNLRKVKFFHLSRFKVLSVKSNFTDDQMLIRCEFFYPKIFLTSFYKSNMTLNQLVFESKGIFNLTMKQVSAKILIKGKLKNVDGEDYMEVYKFQMDPDPKGMQFSITGIFPDETLSEYEKLEINFTSIEKF